MVAYCYMLLFHCRLGHSCIPRDELVVTKHIWGTLNSNYHHTQFIAQTFQYISGYFQGYKFRPEGQVLGGILSLGIPDYWCFIQENKNTSLGTTHHMIPIMVFIDQKHSCYFQAAR